MTATAAQPARGFGPALALAVFGPLIGLTVGFFGPFAFLPVVGLLFVALVLAHPEYGIALFLSTFLMTYPESLQGSGFLTINNVLGVIFLLHMVYKVYQENDWWFLYSPEVQLLAFITLMFFLSDRLNGPDPQLRELLGVVEHGSENMRTFVTRCAFTVFFINFIRTPRHILMIYLLAVAFMVTSSLLSIHDVLQGGGFAGYRAASSSVIAAAANPNREAMFSILAIAELYYVTTWIPFRAIWLIVVPTIALMCLCVFLTASRSGLLGLTVCVIAIVIEERFTLKTLLVAALLGAIVGLLVVEFTPEKSFERITNLPFTQGGEEGVGAGSLSRRAYTWEIAADIFRENPVLGVGIGNWDLARFLKDPTQSIGAPHSSYFLALCEGGVFCLAAFLILLWRCWRNIRFAERFVEDPDFAIPELRELRWVIKSTKTDLLVLVFFSAFADLWQLVIVFWLVSIGIVLKRMFEQATLAQFFKHPALDSTEPVGV
ncbi:MAG TPA: O-antigen ligase family protein [Candidatus Margulisiibacteriota bacterium]|nr:O-antigen ligase family protein [Candidatus Margulisiibacteriota bacterium]